MDRGSTASLTNEENLLSCIRTKDRRLYEKYFGSVKETRLLAGGGSDRRFYRITQGYGSVILMLSESQDGEFKKYVQIANFLRDIGIGVPQIYDVNHEKGLLFMEDLGDTSLFNIPRSSDSGKNTISWYRKALETLAHMQIEGGKKWRCCDALKDQIFDYRAFLDETQYFQNYFLKTYCNLSIPEEDKLSREFGELARRVAAEPIHFMHRDFQSQNIMIQKGRIRILDLQGARRGLLQYDLASILKDAYVVLSEETRKNLLCFYLKELHGKGYYHGDYEHFIEIFTLAGLQRNMQALGAFSYLSLVKRKVWFQQYIPAGVQYLSSALEAREDFLQLRLLIQKIKQRMLPNME